MISAAHVIFLFFFSTRTGLSGSGCYAPIDGQLAQHSLKTLVGMGSHLLIGVSGFLDKATHSQGLLEQA